MKEFYKIYYKTNKLTKKRTGYTLTDIFVTVLFDFELRINYDKLEDIFTSNEVSFFTYLIEYACE